MDLLEFINKTERDHFRTHQDVGANWNALFVWNQLREFAGLPRLTKHDLIRRTIDTYREDLERANARHDYKWAEIYRDTIDDLEKEINK